jgi:hypothetical protein
MKFDKDPGLESGSSMKEPSPEGGLGLGDDDRAARLDQVRHRVRDLARACTNKGAESRLLVVKQKSSAQSEHCRF